MNECAEQCCLVLNCIQYDACVIEIYALKLSIINDANECNNYKLNDRKTSKCMSKLIM